MNKYESFSSILNLAPDDDPYAEAVKLINEATHRVAHQLIDLKTNLDNYHLIINVGHLEHINPMSPDYYYGEIGGDMKRIGGDFKCAAAKLYETEGFSQIELSDATRDKLLLNDEYCRYAK